MKRLVLVVLIIAAWFAAIGLIFGAEPPAITATTNGPQLILSPILPAGSGAIWRVNPGAKPGTWTLLLITASNGQPAAFDGSLVLTFGENPNPQPQPQPQPIVKPAWIAVIHESKDSTPAVAIVRDAKAWKDAATALGIKWFTFDRDIAATQFPEATKVAIKFGLPCVVSVAPGEVARCEKLPATIDAMVALVNAKGGAR